MKSGRNYTIGERSIMIIGILSGKNLEEINLLLKEEQKKTKTTPREFNKSSYDMVIRSYVPSMFTQSKLKENKKNFGEVWEHIKKPKKISDLKNAE